MFKCWNEECKCWDGECKLQSFKSKCSNEDCTDELKCSLVRADCEINYAVSMKEAVVVFETEWYKYHRGFVSFSGGVHTQTMCVVQTTHGRPYALQEEGRKTQAWQIQLVRVKREEQATSSRQQAEPQAHRQRKKGETEKKETEDQRSFDCQAGVCDALK